LPNHIIEKILNYADLPLWIRLEFIEFGFKLHPERVQITQPLDSSLNFLYQLKAVKCRHYRKSKIFNIISHYSDYDYTINIIEYGTDMLFKFEKIIIDYETGDIYSLRNTTCNAFTGKFFNNELN
jgi:hypothetical protein